jgi:hypothetical protein
MGFTEDQAENALRLNHGNADWAVNYLLNGPQDNSRAIVPVTDQNADAKSVSFSNDATVIQPGMTANSG